MTAADTMHAATDESTKQSDERAGEGASTEPEPRRPEMREERQFVTQVAEAIGRTASVETVFGEPVHRGEVTVIPVARIAWGFGGGGGPSRLGRGDGGDPERPGASRMGRFWGAMPRRQGGGGGGARMQPMGYIVIRDGDAQFRPIRWMPSLAIGLIGFLVGARLGRRRARS